MSASSSRPQQANIPAPVQSSGARVFWTFLITPLVAHPVTNLQHELFFFFFCHGRAVINIKRAAKGKGEGTETKKKKKKNERERKREKLTRTLVVDLFSFAGLVITRAWFPGNSSKQPQRQEIGRRRIANTRRRIANTRRKEKKRKEKAL